MYGYFHNASLVMMVLVTVLLCVLWKKGKIKDPCKVVRITSIIVLVLEIYKQIVFNFSVTETGIAFDYQWYIFPWQFCSTPLYVGLLAGFSKGKLHKNYCAYLATYALFAGLAVMLYPGDVFTYWPGICVQTMICHGSMVVIAIFLYYTEHVKAEWKTLLHATPLFLLMMSVAVVLNTVMHKFVIGHDAQFSMFFLCPECEYTLPVMSNIQNMLSAYSWGYPVSLIIYALGFTLVAGLILLVAIIIKKLKDTDFDAEYAEQDEAARLEEEAKKAEQLARDEKMVEEIEKKSEQRKREREEKRAKKQAEKEAKAEEKRKKAEAKEKAEQKEKREEREAERAYKEKKKKEKQEKREKEKKERKERKEEKARKRKEKREEKKKEKAEEKRLKKEENRLKRKARKARIKKEKQEKRKQERLERKKARKEKREQRKLEKARREELERIERQQRLEEKKRQEALEKVQPSGDEKFDEFVKEIVAPDLAEVVEVPAFEEPETVTVIEIERNVIEPERESEGLSFRLNSDGNYGLAKMGACRDYHVVVPKSFNGACVNAINNCAFEYCTEIESVYVPEGVTKIGILAFSFCVSLTKVTLPESLAEIEMNAFDHCKKLENIEYNGTRDEWNAIKKTGNWDAGLKNYTIHCLDGKIIK